MTGKENEAMAVTQDSRPIGPQESMQDEEWQRMEIGNLLFGHSRGACPVKRARFEEPFVKFLETAGFDSYGGPADGKMAERFTDEGGDWFFENRVFVMRPYYWGDDDEVAAKPNFLYKPMELEIRWYKYPLRDAYSDREMDAEAFATMLENCLKSIEEE